MHIQEGKETQKDYSVTALKFFTNPRPNLKQSVDKSAQHKQPHNHYQKIKSFNVLDKVTRGDQSLF